ncbi:MAG TPA: hypothetical protein VMD30_04445, partial [Tepidisphaeraceae bacterium]|nr:hypothetical protein [Tepidisphaeraceae bacterium]
MIASTSPSPLLRRSPLEAGPTPERTFTVWGLQPLELHDHYWASLGVQVVRQGEPIQIVSDAELYLLTDPRSLIWFNMADVMEALNWIKPQVLFVRLHDNRERGYGEKAITDTHGRFVRFQRFYDASDDLRLARLVITPIREIARLWQESPDVRTGWRRLRRYTPRHERLTLSVKGSVFDRTQDREISRFMRVLISTWRHPNSTIRRAGELEPQVWVDPDTVADAESKFIAPVWVGAGRRIPAG